MLSAPGFSCSVLFQPNQLFSELGVKRRLILLNLQVTFQRVFRNLRGCSRRSSRRYKQPHPEVLGDALIGTDASMTVPLLGIDIILNVPPRDSTCSRM